MNYRSQEYEGKYKGFLDGGDPDQEGSANTNTRSIILAEAKTPCVYIYVKFRLSVSMN